MKEQKREEGNRFWRIFIISISSIIILVALAVLVTTYFSQPLETRVLDVRFRVSDLLGFELNSSALTFGVAFPGNSVSKNIFLTNERDFPIDVEVYASESVAPYLTMASNITLQPFEKAKIGFTLNIPSNMSFGNYSGQVVLKIFKA